MPYSDKDRQRKAQREFLQNKKKLNPIWHRELKKRQRQKRDNIHDIVNQIKRTLGCLLCDENDPKKLQFHHVVPEFKIATVAQLICNRSKLITVLKEIDKCVCVCTACHVLLQKNLEYVKNTMRNEKWFRDWGLHEALTWSLYHPQHRIKKGNFIEVLMAVVRNSQFQDMKKFKKIPS
ncbi:hypothetical protein [Oryzomonas rubra]|uniref:HNH endonuclease n=1 Tax=Oryzomonas rubra TaxID=2509454 RepID=A0A5A9XM74_9BACT|nr:hypothetical protein [Oryzomonas rubra]KAA0894252.1 hypothetical protein ET418_04675 [Oryzomonas rubra]